MYPVGVEWVNVFVVPDYFTVEVLYKFGVLEKRLNKHMDKVVNEGSQWNKWVKDMQQMSKRYE